jgi:hypothetical protein
MAIIYIKYDIIIKRDFWIHSRIMKLLQLFIGLYKL